MHDIDAENTPLVKSTISQSGSSTSAGQKRLLLVKCFTAVISCYLVYGVCHESITRQLYDGERFSFTLWLITVQTLTNMSVASIIVQLSRPGEVDKTPLKYYFVSALFFCGAIFGSNQALQYLSYPSQVVGKACKPIPVLILSGLVGRKSYNYVKYLCVLTLVLGITMFLYHPTDETVQKQGVGHGLLIFSLICDGLCGGMQEKVRSKFSPNENDMMLWTNFCSFLILIPFCFLSGDFFGGNAFIPKHPEILPRILAFCLCSVAGQYFIFLTIKNFGPLTVSIITTCRKFFSVLFSVFIFGNVLTAQQWVGAIIVFSGLVVDIYFGEH